MAAATILHVGEDICQRIPVMETAGFVVRQSEIAVPAIHRVFENGDGISAVIFHSDISAPPEPTVRETRSLTDAPLVLFENPAVNCDESEFNLVIPPLTPPAIWLKKLSEVVEASRELRKGSAHLQQDCREVRSRSAELRAESAHNRICPIDSEALWNGESGSIAESKPPEEERGPDGLREKAG